MTVLRTSYKIWFYVEIFFLLLTLIISFGNTENLDISERNLTKIIFDLQIEKKNIHRIDASSNQITSINSKLLKGFKKIQSLFLCNNNNFDMPTNEIFLQSQSLQHFFCEHCGIRKIYNETFSELPELWTLNLINNKIQSIDVNAFQYNLKLELLLLDGNKLINLNSNLVEHLKNFWFLSMNNNHNFNFTTNHQLISRSLRDFSCNHCSFIKITNITFNNIPNIKRLSLNNNHINYISRDAFQLNLKLNHIDVEKNQLKIFPYEIINNNKFLETLCLDLNPFEMCWENNLLKDNYKTNYRDSCANQNPELYFEKNLSLFIENDRIYDRTNDVDYADINNDYSDDDDGDDELKNNKNNKVDIHYVDILLYFLISAILIKMASLIYDCYKHQKQMVRHNDEEFV